MLLENLSKRAKVSEEIFLRIAGAASRSYKAYPVPKHDGTDRIIYQPSRALKSIQRMLVRSVVLKAPVHEAATAYKKGASIRENAELHRETSFTTRIDFSNFFPSFKRAEVRRFIEITNETFALGLDQKDVKFVLDICLRYDETAIGAPSSPSITNAIMFPFDVLMYEYCRERGLIYTRYADDMFISSNEKDRILGIENTIEEFLKEDGLPKLKINAAKTVHLSKKGHRSVTGLVITPDHKISLGRGRKRYIKSLVYQYFNGTISPENRGKLEGLLAFASDVEPSFLDRLNAKFGKDVGIIFRNG
jgi:hypothetical protein